MKKTLILSALALAASTVHAFNASQSGYITRADNINSTTPIIDIASKFQNTLSGSQSNQTTGSFASNSKDRTLNMGSINGDTNVTSGTIAATDDIGGVSVAAMGGSFTPTSMSTTSIDNANEGHQIVDPSVGGYVSDTNIALNALVRNTDSSTIDSSGHSYGSYNGNITNTSMSNSQVAQDTGGLVNGKLLYGPAPTAT